MDGVRLYGQAPVSQHLSLLRISVSIFFMFFLGLELDLDQIKKSWKITLPVAAASIIIPGNLYYLK